MDRIQELNKLIDKASLISHIIDRALSDVYSGPYNEAFRQYSIWKLECKSFFSKECPEKETYHKTYSEYYSVFTGSDGVSDLADMAYTDGVLYLKGLREDFKDEEGHYIAGAESIRQMNLVTIGLKKRKDALINILKDLKNKKVIIIEINSNGLITNSENGLTHQYKKIDKRFKLIKLLAESGDYVTTQKIIKETRYTNVGFVSKEKREINSILFEKLKIRKFINDGEKRLGYKLNPDYLIKIK